MSKIKEQIYKDKLLLYIWSKISELWDYSKFSLIVAVIILISTLIFYSDIAYWLFGNTDESKGKLLTLLLSIVGAIVVVYGLKINSRRLKQGNEQLKQQEKNNTNTRFKDAVILLGNDNPAVVLGGIHTLNQIAFNNSEYREIVVDILCSYIREKSDELNINLKDGRPSTVIQSIIDILFNTNYVIYNHFNYNLKNTTFKFVTFKKEFRYEIIDFDVDIDQCNFEKCSFESFILRNNGCSSVKFEDCILSNFTIKYGFMEDSEFINCSSKDLDFDLGFKIQDVNIINCNFTKLNILGFNISNINFEGTSISDSKFDSAKISFCNFNDSVFVDYNEFNNLKCYDNNIDFVNSFTRNRYL